MIAVQHTEIGFECRKWIVCYSRLCCREHVQKATLTCIWKPHESKVSDELHGYFEAACVAFLTRICLVKQVIAGEIDRRIAPTSIASTTKLHGRFTAGELDHLTGFKVS